MSFTEAPVEHSAEEREFTTFPETVAELFGRWKEAYHRTEDEHEKQLLNHAILEMSMALQTAKLSASEVHIEVDSSGEAAGLYYPGSRRIVITDIGLSQDPSTYEQILVHESTHAGRMTGQRIMDEGMTELHTVHVTSQDHGIYHTERTKAEDTLSEVGVETALELYDYDQPEILIERYIQEEIDRAWDIRFASQFPDQQELLTVDTLPEHLRGTIDTFARDLDTKLETGLPALYHRASMKIADACTTMILERHHRDMKPTH